MEYALLIAGAIVCAIFSIRATHLLISSLWLAGVSIFTAITLYIFGAHEIAVIELSVGAGLVTVLFVFAIGIAGDNTTRPRPLIPRPLAWVFAILIFLLLTYLAFSPNEGLISSTESPFESVLWETRTLDVLVQIVIIFSGVLGILGLLTEPKSQTIPRLNVSKPKDVGEDTLQEAYDSEYELEKKAI